MEEGAVGMEGGAMFAGGPRAIMVSDNQFSWHRWSCPLTKVVGLHVDRGLLAVIGDDQLAVSEVRHQGRVWQVVEVEGATCVHIAVGSRVFVGTKEGRLFQFTIKRPRGILGRIKKTAPIFHYVGELEWVQGEIDTITLGGEE